MNFLNCSDNSKLYVKDWGSGPTVILIHGWPLTADSWDDQALALAESGYRVISYDRRGFGRSSQPWTGYDYDRLADDLATVIDYAGVQDITLVGFSMGGGEVARYLSRHQGRAISKVALVSSILPFRLRTPDNPGGTEQTAFDIGAQALRSDRAHFFTGFFRDFFGVGLISHPVSAERLNWAHDMAMQASLRGTLECQKAFSSTDFRPDLVAFTLPTLIIHGTEDRTVPIDGSARPLAKSLPHATMLSYDGAPHGLFATHRERLNRDLLQFLGG